MEVRPALPGRQQKFDVSVGDPIGHRRKTGEITARRQRHGPLPKLAPDSDLLRNRVRAVPDTTIDEMRV
jgi:hypothetical protein